MNSLDLEFYYMSGKPIDLTHLNLGVIHQPRLKDFIDNKMDVSFFSHPFLFDKYMISNKKESVDELVKDLGKLSFLIVYNEITSLAYESDEGVLDLLVNALKLLYKTDNVLVAKTISKIIIDGSIIIGDEELEFISALVVEMMRIDKNDMKKRIEEQTKQAELDELMSEFERRAKKYQEKQDSKNKDFTLMDMVNVIVHSQSVVDYDRVFDMTIYQLKNSYETLIKKESFTINLMHRISPNFKPSEELKLWEENVHIVRSSLNRQD